MAEEVLTAKIKFEAGDLGGMGGGKAGKKNVKDMAGVLKRSEKHFKNSADGALGAIGMLGKAGAIVTAMVALGPHIVSGLSRGFEEINQTIRDNVSPAGNIENSTIIQQHGTVVPGGVTVPTAPPPPSITSDPTGPSDEFINNNPEIQDILDALPPVATTMGDLGSTAETVDRDLGAFGDLLLPMVLPGGIITNFGVSLSTAVAALDALAKRAEEQQLSAVGGFLGGVSQGVSNFISGASEFLGFG